MPAPTTRGETRRLALRALAWSLPLWIAAICVTAWTLRELALLWQVLAFRAALGLDP